MWGVGVLKKEDFNNYSPFIFSAFLICINKKDFGSPSGYLTRFLSLLLQPSLRFPPPTPIPS